MSLVKVIDAVSRELKRWETPNAKPLAVMNDGKLVLTPLGKRLRYTVSGKDVIQK